MPGLLRLSKAALVFFILIAAACVPRGQYDAVEESLAHTKKKAEEEVEACRRQIETIQASLGAGERQAAHLGLRIRELEAEIQEARQGLADSASERQRLASDLSAVVRDRSRLRQSVEEMERALRELADRKAAAERRIAEFQNLVSRFQDMIDAGRLQVRIVDGRMVVELATDVLFGSGSARLSDEGRQAVREVGEVLAKIPNRRFQVEGHTDNVPISTARFGSNWELASARAVNVVSEMVASGVPPRNVSAAAYGEHRPAADNDTPEGRTANRRIEIVLLPDLSQLPGYEQLERLAESER